MNCFIDIYRYIFANSLQTDSHKLHELHNRRVMYVMIYFKLCSNTYLIIRFDCLSYFSRRVGKIDVLLLLISNLL